MSRILKVLCVHGVGRHPKGGAWEGQWKAAITRALAETDETLEPVFHFVHYDDLFLKRRITFLGALEALAKLGWSGLTSGFARSTRESGRRAPGGRLKWTAGMVVKWVEDEAFREETRQRIGNAVDDEKPDVICAHSLGSLICYDTFVSRGGEEVANGRVFVSLGSQIGNPFVRGNFAGGRLSELETLRYWFHLYNCHDDVFTAPLRMSGPNFAQVETPFDEPGWMDHSAERYLGHADAVERAWSEIALDGLSGVQFALGALPGRASRLRNRVAKTLGSPTKRALLVGINDYPDPDMRLDGCVNDVFLVSSALQDLGFEQDEVRIILDRRATSEAVKDRLDWLLDGAREGDSRVFYYSGHGAQIPGYGIGEKVDRRDEALVTWDFDWTRERSIVDDYLYDLYVQLPYGCDLTMVFDCCHSGGLTRLGGVKARGINPPDDIRHRALKWNAPQDSWEPLALQGAYAEFASASMNLTGEGEEAGGKPTHRLGQAMSIRSAGAKGSSVANRQRALRHRGPYMPALWYACDEHEYAYEYRHGSSSYGAFTWSLASLARRLRSEGRRLNPNAFLDQLRKEVQRINPNQTPQVVMPTAKKTQPIPWLAPSAARKATRKTAKKTTRKAKGKGKRKR